MQSQLKDLFLQSIRIIRLKLPLVRTELCFFQHARNVLPGFSRYGFAEFNGYRWAIAAYVQALQLSQNASIQDVPPEIRDNLKKEVK